VNDSPLCRPVLPRVARIAPAGIRLVGRQIAGPIVRAAQPADLVGGIAGSHVARAVERVRVVRVNSWTCRRLVFVWCSVPVQSNRLACPPVSFSRSSNC
jgi:hypothetical protein